MGSSGPGRVRVERGIYRQPNGKYAVCWRHAGRLRFRTIGFDVAEARRERLALIAATHEGRCRSRHGFASRRSPAGGSSVSRLRSQRACVTRVRSRRTATSSTATCYDSDRGVCRALRNHAKAEATPPSPGRSWAARLGLEKAARSNSIDAVVTLVAVSSSKPANGLASHGPAEVRAPSRR
jgi:hypothetical protein